MRLRRLILVALVSAVFAAATFAQSPNGTISGTVFDPAGKVIAGAEITVINDATRVQYFSKTNYEGLYVIQNLSPGRYRLQVAKLGFKTLVKPDIVLNVQDALAINFNLPIGAIAETVTVEGGAPMINIEDASVSTVVDREFAENLPMNGRSFQTLIQLTPGVVVTASNFSDGGQFSVNGRRGASNYWMVDGVGANIGIGATGRVQCRKWVGGRPRLVQCIWRHQQSSINRCAARVQNPNFHLRARVWKDTGRADLDCYSFRNQSISRHSVRLSAKRRS